MTAANAERVALVTGAARGQGLAIVERLRQIDLGSLELGIEGRQHFERAMQLRQDMVNPRLGLAELQVMSGEYQNALDTTEGILSLHGRWSDWTSEDDQITLPALPTLHPAFLLRQPGAKKKAWADLMTLMRRLEPSP